MASSMGPKAESSLKPKTVSTPRRPFWRRRSDWSRIFFTTPVSVLPASAQESVNVLGDAYRLLLTGAETDGKFCFVEVSSNPGSFVPPHIHEREDEAFHFIEGQMEVTDASGVYVAGPGDSVFLPRGQMHSFRIIGDGPAHFYIHAVPAGIEVMFREMNEAIPGPPDPATLVPLCARHGINILPPPGA